MDTAEYLTALGSRSPTQIRNFCMVAHVDHGKTTLSDHLLANNGVLSEGLAGQVRFLDSREDEQERWITMKVSSIALRHTTQALNDATKHSTYLLHLVDSPGHIDFSSEVSTAIRVADGAVILVDLVDMVTTQTMSMLRQVFSEGLSMVLVLNKLDLLVTKIQLTPEEAYLRCRNVIEACNATIATYVNQLEISGERPDLLSGIPEENEWFSPARGNVVFASCLDGWGFSLDYFARKYSTKYSIDIQPEHLWGNYYFDAKNKAVLDKPRREDHPVMAVQLIFAQLWKVHETFLAEEGADEPTCLRISEALDVDPKFWNRPKLDGRGRLSALLKHWMPLADAILDMICHHSYSPIDSQQRRLPRLIPSFASLPEDLRAPIQSCSASPDAPMVAFISKLIDTESLAGQTIGAGRTEASIEDNFVGFVRIYSGRLVKGQHVRLQTVDGGDVHCDVERVYLLRGRGLEEVKEMSAGCLCGVGGITKHIIKYATISSDDRMPSLVPPKLSSSSIVRQTVMPVNPADLEQLVRGLNLLNKVDPQVELFVMPTGEHVIGAAGEIHAERCVKDLNDTFAQVEMRVSEPLVSYRETVVNAKKAKSVKGVSVGGHFSVTIHVRSFNDEVMKEVCKEGSSESKSVNGDRIASKLAKDLLEEDKKRWGEVGKLWSWGPMSLGYCGVLFFDNTEGNVGVTSPTSNPGGASAIGGGFPEVQPGGDGNNPTEGYQDRMVRIHRARILAGLQNVAAQGPMADEPLVGVAFIISKMEFSESAVDIPGPTLAGNIMSCVRDTSQRAFELHSRRLVEPFYDCTVYSAGTTQGKIYAILQRRRAEILEEVPNEGSDLFFIACFLPAADAFGLQDELRVATSGAATAQLRMAHWGIMPEDPYYRPTTREEIEDDGVDVQQNFSAQTLERVRKRKGLHRELTVDSATKQKFSIKN